MILGFDISLYEIVAIAVLAFIVIKLAQIMLEFYKAKVNAPPKLTESGEYDLFEAAYQDRKLAAKTNRRPLNKKLLLTSDGHVQEIYYKYWGSNNLRTCTDMFFKPKKFLMEPRWVVIPEDLIWDRWARNIRIDARDFIALGDKIWVPVFTANRPHMRRHYRKLIMDHVMEVLLYYARMQSTKNRFNGAAAAGKPTDLQKWNIRLRAYADGTDEAYPEAIE